MKNDTPPSADTSASLLLRVKKQDAEAWMQLVRWIGPLVLRWCRKAGLQAGDCDEVSQQVMTKVWQRFPTFRKEREGDSFRSWVYTITKNCLIDFHRERQKAPGPLPGDLPAAPDPTEATTLEQEALCILLDQLRTQWGNEPGFRAFYRTAVDGLTGREVAEELNMTPEGVRQHKSRWAKRLRDQLATQFGELLG